MRSLLAVLPGLLLTVLQVAHAASPPVHAATDEALYESSLGPHGAAPFRRTRAQLEAMGGTWIGDRFITRERFANTNDASAATFVTPVSYAPARERRPRERR